MYYYYDVLLNFQEDNNLYEFYEWEETDNIDFVKKIPLFKVKSNIIKDFTNYQIKLSKEFLLQIKNKTILKSMKDLLKNTFIICDTKNALAIELNDDGEVVSRSKLLLSDEMNLSEIMFTMKESNLEYEKIKKYEPREELRQMNDIKKLINCEINTLYESKNYSKLKYLYYEWFDKLEDNIESMYKKMKEDLQNNFTNSQQKIYNLIKKTYNKAI